MPQFPLRYILAFMDLHSYFAQTRSTIRDGLSSLGAEYKEILAPSASCSDSVVDRIIEFSTSGKMIRGSLVFLGHQLFSRESDYGITEAGCAMELFQSGLLIHDDIMDRDSTRRGMPTLHTRYAEECGNLGSRQPERAGEALGICAGDICFFLGHEALSRAAAALARINSGESHDILGTYCSRELAKVGLAQMKDVEWGLTTQTPSKSDVMRMYLHKTARYTFSMPLAVGAILAKRHEAIKALEVLGELIGVVFQIRDDELGVFGSETELGKPIGSDIREGKKTLYYIELLDRTPPGDREILSNIFGNPSCSASDIQYIRSQILSLGIKSDIDAISEEMCQKSTHLIDSFNTEFCPDEESLDVLRELAVYVTRRIS